MIRMLSVLYCLYDLQSSEGEADVHPMQGTPKKTSKVEFDWLRTTAN